MTNLTPVPVGSRHDKKKRAKVTFKGLGSFLCEPHEVEGYVRDMQVDEPHEHTVEWVWMTDDKFNNLPDFQGF